MSINYIEDLKTKPLVVWLVWIYVLLIFGEMVFIKKANDFVFLIIFICYFFIFKHFNINGRILIIVGLVFLCFCPLLMLINGILAERLGIWVFLSILLGTILIFLKERNE